MNKLIATDLDGTLFYPKARLRLIKPKALRFIRRFIDNGGRFAIVSGRNEYFGKKVAKKIGRPIGIIGCNSAFIIQNNERIKQDYFDNSRLAFLINYINENYKPMILCLMSEKYNMISKSTKFSIWYAFCYMMYAFFQGVYREPNKFDREAYDEEVQYGKVFKIMALFGAGKKAKLKAMEVNKKLRKKFGDEFEFSWSQEAIEITPSLCSKAEGLKFYIDYLKINRDDVYVVGDSGNDISMFNDFYENSFCMEHASLSVSKYANHIIKRFVDIEKYMMKEGQKEENEWI